jgi:asparagine synthase (glutamine-hydrolysing)
MCGIVGQARQDGGMPSRALLERMCAALEHRGPDSRGVHVEPGAGLGIQRLRIIDLVTGDQPIFSEDGSVVVVLNGEIYNFQELRDELLARGHRFSSTGDTEVIVHLYEELGESCIERLHGMFGLAIWDGSRRRLVLARDRLGKKPLFYCVGDGVISFASELGALLQNPDVSRKIDLAAIDAYLAFRYIPSPLTAFAAARKLPPAHRLVYEHGHARVERYWRLDFAAKRRFASEQEALDGVREQLRRAVRRRMISDVPLGAFLSGGVDSAAVVATMAEASSEPVKTFSIGFRSELDERPLARLVAQRFATDHHELVVEPEAAEILPLIVRHHGEPFADATSVPTFYLAQMARRHVTVALNGDGGDEAFGGYNRYQAALLAARLGGLPRAARQAAAALTRRVPPNGRIDSWQMRARRLGETLTLDPAGRHLQYMTSLQGLRREGLYAPEFAAELEPSAVEIGFRARWTQGTAAGVLDHMLEVDSLTFLPDDLLAKVDIATMACSLEGRSPLLDHELMQFAASLPESLKVGPREKKIALRRALRGVVPEHILDAPKRGFQPPVAAWLRGDLRDYARDVLLDRTSRSRGYFRTEAVGALLDEHAAGAADHSQGIWTLLVLELWHREFVDRPQPVASHAAAPAPG